MESESIVERANKAALAAEFEGRPVGSILSKEIVAVIVRTTISAMREPTGQMVNAGADAVDDGETYGCQWKAENAWRAMLDAALK